MSLRLSGINPLSYMGVEPYTPPALVIKTRTPTVNDSQNVNVGTLWLITNPQELWYLASLSMNQALWIQLYPGGGGGGASEFITDSGSANQMGGIINILGGSGGISTIGMGDTVTINLTDTFASSYVTDDGTAVPADNVITIHGGSNINTSGMGSTVTVNLDNNVSISGNMHVGTDLTVVNTLTLSTDTNGVLQTNGSGVVSATNGTNGQVLIGGGTAPVWANLTSSGGTVIITNGPNTINLESSGGGGGSPVAFYAYQPTEYQVPGVNSAFYDYISYTMGTEVALNVVLNTGGGFYPGNGAGTPASFTAPISGKYYFSSVSALTQGQTGISTNPLYDAYNTITTPSRTYAGYSGNIAVGGSPNQSWLYVDVRASTTVQLNAGDVVTFQTIGRALDTATPPPTAYAWQLNGSQPTGGPANVYPGGNQSFDPTYIEGFLVEASSSPGAPLSFSAYNPTDTTQAALSTYYYGSSVPLTIEVNEGGAFYPGDGLGTPASLTAPVRGYYMFNLTAYTTAGTSGGTSLSAYIVGPSANYGRHHYDNQTIAGPSTAASVTISALIALNVGQQVTFAAANDTGGAMFVVKGPTSFGASPLTVRTNIITGYLLSEF